MEFSFTFHTIALAIAKLFILMFIGYFLYRRKLIDDKFTDTLSLMLVRAIFPALIISKITGHFSFNEYAYWWIFPLAAIIFSLAGMVIAMAALRFFPGFKSPREFMCSSAFQNCGYLPMNLILFSFASGVADRLFIFTFLYIIGFNILMWSLIPLFLSGTLKSDFKVSVLFTPPIVATIFSLLWVAFMGKGTIPHVIGDPLMQLGNAAFPMAMVALGAYLCRYEAHNPKDKGPLFAAGIIKLLLFPALVLSVLMPIPLAAECKFLLFLEAIMPTAVSLVVIGSYTASDNKFFSSSIFYTHVAAIFSIPLWLALFDALVK